MKLISLVIFSQISLVKNPWINSAKKMDELKIYRYIRLSPSDIERGTVINLTNNALNSFEHTVSTNTMSLGILSFKITILVQNELKLPN